MDREVLLEIGCEEIPAAWLPALTGELGQRFAARLDEHRLSASAPIETFSTPRRLALRIERVSERQADFEETVMGPPVSAGFRGDGEPTPAALGFARKHGVEVPDLARVETPKGVYLAYHRRHRNKAAVDTLPDVLGATLRDLTFPKLMRWDACLDDGRGELLFGRPIRWILFLYGGRVVPFVIARTPGAQGTQVQDVRSGAVTYGHRFLATTGRPGRAIKVRTFHDYQTRLASHFVVLDRLERRDRIVSELDVHARRLGGRVMSGVHLGRLLDEVPDLVEYPAVVAGTFAPGFLDLPREVLTVTLAHHQHYFPVVGPEGQLLATFLAVMNTTAANGPTVARNAERVVTARLRDATFFWHADRATPASARLERLDTVLFHQALGSYRAKAHRIAGLAEWMASDAYGQPDRAVAARDAALAAKTDLTTELVREFTDLQGVMGGIYAREDGHAEAVWKAVYYHYLPVGVEADAPPSAGDQGSAAVSWAAVSVADKLDTIVGLMLSGELPTGSRDPYALRRQAHGLLRVLVDLPELTGLDRAVQLGALVERARATLGLEGRDPQTVLTFLRERLMYLFEQRGFAADEVRAVVHSSDRLSPLGARRRLEALGRVRSSPDFVELAVLFKRVKNIARELAGEAFAAAESDGGVPLESVLTEPAERDLAAEVSSRGARIAEVLAADGTLDPAFVEAAALRPAVDRFFTEVFVMVDDAALRQGRLRLLTRLHNLVLELADISEIVPDTPART